QFMKEFRRHSCSHKLMMKRLITAGQLSFFPAEIRNNPRRRKGMTDNTVHLVEIQPVFHIFPEPLEADLCKTDKAVYDASVGPADLLQASTQLHFTLSKPI